MRHMTLMRSREFAQFGAKIANAHVPRGREMDEQKGRRVREDLQNFTAQLECRLCGRYVTGCEGVHEVI